MSFATDFEIGLTNWQSHFLFGVRNMTKQITKLYWGYNHKKQEREYITGEEFIRRLEPLITDPVESM